MSPYRRNVIVGVVVLGALVVLGWMILVFAGKAATFFLTTGTPVSLRSDRADGVTDGSAVMYRGVNVGRVIQVRRAPSNQFVYIDILVDAEPPLPSNLHGLIRASSLLGATASIYLEQTGPEPSPKPLTRGTELEASFHPDFTSLAEEVRQRELIAHIDQAVQSFRQQVEKAGTLLESANQIVSAPETRENIRLAVVNLRSATEAADRIGKNVEKFSGSLDALSTEARQTVGEVRTTATSTRKHLDELSKRMNDRMDQVADVLQHLQTVTARIDSGQGTAGKLVNDPKLYENLADAAQELNATVADFRRLVNQWEQEGVHFKLGK